MRLKNWAVLLCATSALVAACSSDDDSMPGNAGGSGNAAGSSGKGNAGAGNVAGKADGGASDSAGSGNAGGEDSAGSGNAGEGGSAGAAGASTTKFTVTLENVATPKRFTSSGVFNTPLGDVAPGPATPGKKYEFTVTAGRKQKLSFATMLAATNDLFFGPNGDGIALYDANGDPITADVTSQIYLWDAGTEINEEPHVGPNTVTKQAAPNTGPAQSGNVVTIANASNGVAFNYPSVASVIKVSVAHLTGTSFKITIENVSSATALMTSEGNFPAPMSPGVWVVHNGKDPLFTVGMPDRGQGLENIAEDGSPSMLGAFATANSGITYPASPGAWVLHGMGSKPLFTTGAADYGKGIEAIAEDGNATPLGSNLADLTGMLAGAVFNTPVGSSAPGPILPGSKYQFSFDASPGDALSFATMLAATNDVFFAPSATGIPLFDGDGEPVTGDVSAQVSLWDAGTEGNEAPGIGPNTVTNQLAPNTGTAGEGKVQLLSATGDAYPYPTAQSVLKVTLAAE